MLSLDDISISPGSCPPPGNCDFEDGLGCSWVQEPLNDDFDWLILPADSANNIGGPVYDHTHLDDPVWVNPLLISYYVIQIFVSLLALSSREPLSGPQ